MSRTACLLIILALLVPAGGTGCRKLTEEEALELARDEIREEMEPEIDRREVEIKRLEEEIARTRERIAKRRTR
ncbi:MAG TPA: hypothetical protein VFG08_09585 [Candidatus Polarisedimenticolia bacterium]|nr:hypothetical protein [Candidatus Polarisedimenticolia bacterium]